MQPVQGVCKGNLWTFAPGDYVHLDYMRPAQRFENYMKYN
jgi:hypothetical protein